MYKQNEGTEQNRKNASPNKGKAAQANKRPKDKEDKANNIQNGRAEKQDQTRKTH